MRLFIPLNDETWTALVDLSLKTGKRPNVQAAILLAELLKTDPRPESYHRDEYEEVFGGPQKA